MDIIQHHCFLYCVVPVFCYCCRLWWWQVGNLCVKKWLW